MEKQEAEIQAVQFKSLVMATTLDLNQLKVCFTRSSRMAAWRQVLVVWWVM